MSGPDIKQSDNKAQDQKTQGQGVDLSASTGATLTASSAAAIVSPPKLDLSLRINASHLRMSIEAPIASESDLRRAIRAFLPNDSSILDKTIHTESKAKSGYSYICGSGGRLCHYNREGNKFLASVYWQFVGAKYNTAEERAAMHATVIATIKQVYDELLKVLPPQAVTDQKVTAIPLEYRKLPYDFATILRFAGQDAIPLGTVLKALGVFFEQTKLGSKRIFNADPDDRLIERKSEHERGAKLSNDIIDMGNQPHSSPQSAPSGSSAPSSRGSANSSNNSSSSRILSVT